MFAMRVELLLPRWLYERIILSEPTGVLLLPWYIMLNDEGRRLAKSESHWPRQMSRLVAATARINAKEDFDRWMVLLLEAAPSLTPTPYQPLVFRIFSDPKNHDGPAGLIRVTWVNSDLQCSPKYETKTVERKNSVWIGISPCFLSREKWHRKEEG